MNIYLDSCKFENNSAQYAADITQLLSTQIFNFNSQIESKGISRNPVALRLKAYSFKEELLYIQNPSYNKIKSDASTVILYLFLNH